MGRGSGDITRSRKRGTGARDDRLSNRVIGYRPLSKSSLMSCHNFNSSPPAVLFAPEAVAS